MLAVAICSLLTASAHADLFISHYVEGGSYNKAVEIANNGDNSINLDGYSLDKSANGNGSWGATLT
ncbi:lamin tail domain-containing protein, partial [Vibrio echinoideorum]|uniref:lamin tail domain-containing protein n=1 Tax=Vibrio echinoideorum TaxID=2100116 RepID=UPI003C74BADD